MSSLSASESQLTETAEPTAVAEASAVQVDHLSVTYRTSVVRRPTIRRLLSRTARGQKQVKEIKAVQDVSFDVAQGTVLGIIGVNGAGKSTLVRTVAGILPPDRGPRRWWTAA